MCTSIPEHAHVYNASHHTEGVLPSDLPHEYARGASIQLDVYRIENHCHHRVLVVDLQTGVHRDCCSLLWQCPDRILSSVKQGVGPQQNRCKACGSLAPVCV